MPNHKATLPSGKILELTMGSLEECDALMSIVCREAVGVKLDIGQNFKGFKALAQSEFNSEMVNTLKSYLGSLLASEAVKSSIFVLMRRGTYDGEKIEGKSTFEPTERRRDYIAAMRETLIFNVGPFFLDILDSKSSEPAQAES